MCERTEAFQLRAYRRMLTNSWTMKITTPTCIIIEGEIEHRCSMRGQTVYIVEVEHNRVVMIWLFVCVINII